MNQLDMDARKAKEMGMTYGQYKAMTYDPTAPMAPPQIPKRRKRDRKFTDAQAFALWQATMTDAEIGKALGVSRAYIQRWRDQLELPSTSKNNINTKKYRLAALQDGTSIVIHENDQI